MSESSVLQLLRPAIRRLVPYHSARSLSMEADIFLDANETPWDPQTGEESALGGMNRYPEPQPKDLRVALAKLYDVATERIFLGRGSDEAIDVLIRSFCEAGRDAILICPPTYGVYSVMAEIQGASVVEAPLESQTFALDTQKIRELWDPKIKLIFLCSPNNPTANLLSKDAILQLCEFFQGRAMVVVDEAYLEFSGEQSLSTALTQFSNLIVLRTLSKAYGLAAARCGVALGDPQVIEAMQKVRAPYPISQPSLVAVLSALTPEKLRRAQARVSQICEERERVMEELEALPNVEHVFNSDANFVLVKFSNSNKVFRSCAGKGVLLRDRSTMLGLENCLRISIGSPAQNDRLLALLKEAAVGA